MVRPAPSRMWVPSVVRQGRAALAGPWSGTGSWALSPTGVEYATVARTVVRSRRARAARRLRARTVIVSVLMNPPDSHLDLLARPLFAHFATVAGDCSPRVNPMWFLWDAEEGVFKLTHTKERHNFRYLQALSLIHI